MIKWRSTFKNTDGSVSIYEHNQEFADMYRAHYGNYGGMVRIESDEPIIDFQRKEANHA